jgi:hypothetical protein
MDSSGCQARFTSFDTTSSPYRRASPTDDSFREVASGQIGISHNARRMPENSYPSWAKLVRSGMGLDRFEDLLDVAG